jgi:hypothetical protein
MSQTLYKNEKYVYLFNNIADARKGYIVLRANAENKNDKSVEDYLSHSIKHLKNILRTENVSYLPPGTSIKCLAVREMGTVMYWQILCSGKIGWAFVGPDTMKKNEKRKL